MYGNKEVTLDEDPPLNLRCNTVLMWKKCWSYYMLDQHTSWSDIAKTGNPTKSTQVNRTIRGMRKMEAAQHGLPSKARRTLQLIEFEKIIETLCWSADPKV